jgi:hypothetical protein
LRAFTRNDTSASAPPSLSERLKDLPTSVRLIGAGLLVGLLLFSGWFGFEALQAKTNLEQAKISAEQSKDALLNGRSGDATQSAESAQLHAQQARAATHSLPWSIAAAIPVLGSPLRTTQQISDVVAGLADEVLLPTATMGATISPDRLFDGTRIDLKLLREEQPRLSELSAAATRLNDRAQAIAAPAYLSLIGDARSQLQAQTSQLAQLLGNTAIAARLAPSMMGADGPRTYLMAFQTPAEARGTGGLVGGMAVLRFTDGIPTVDELSTNAMFKESRANIDLGPDFNRVYGWMNPYADFRNSNISPHFPYAAQIWRSMWESESGLAVDGVIAVDPIVLSYILGAIGPVRLPDGEVVSQENVVELTMSKAYFRFPDAGAEQWDRKLYLRRIAAAVVEKMAGPLPSARKLLDALGRGASERRISVWSSIPADQAILEETPLAHAVPDDAGPYAQVVINNLAGNKMDYYLRREIEFVADGCQGDMRNSTVTVQLINTAPPDAQLPDNVAAISGLAPQFKLDAPRGTMVSSVRVLATQGAKLLSVTSNGKRANAFTHMENGHPSFEIQLAIPPGKTGELTFRLSEPTSPGEPRVPVQPLIDSVSPRIGVPACS